MHNSVRREKEGHAAEERALRLMREKSASDPHHARAQDPLRLPLPLEKKSLHSSLLRVPCYYTPPLPSCKEALDLDCFTLRV